MSVDDFFSKVDSKLQKLQDTDASTKEAADQALILVKDVVRRLRPLAETYEQQLKNRGLKASLSLSDTSIGLTLKFKDGGHHGISLGPEGNASRLEFKGYYTNDDGKHYHSTEGRSYGPESWDDAFFKERIEKCIDDFLFYAPRHGGV